MAAILHIIWIIVVGTICVIIQGLTGRSIRIPDAPNFFRASNISNTSSQSSDTWMTTTRPPKGTIDFCLYVLQIDRNNIMT